MSELFLNIVNMSIAAGWLVLAVVILRLFLRKAPKWLNPVLWGIVGLRLILPFSIESVLSLIPSVETISPEIMYSPEPVIESGFPIVNNVVNPVITDSFAPQGGTSVNPLQVWIYIASVIWIIGIIAMLTYTVFSFLRLRHRVQTSVRLYNNIYQSENVPSPFVLGIFRPRIYLPANLEKENISCVIAHEQTHIKRHDNWWKPLGFLMLSVYWFHPLLWLGYILFCRDIELACDERVIKELSANERADYSQALLNCSVSKHMAPLSPLAFSEVNVKDRVKNVLAYKKPAFMITATAVLACVAVAVCFLTNPKTVVSKEEISTPFSAEVRKAEILTEEGGVRRLYLGVVINNRTDKSYDDVWFELKLNKEMRPYIASRVLKFTSDKMDVIAEGSENDFSAGAGAEKPPVVGFEHGWNMTLTAEEELKDWFDLTPESITDALKQVEVDINWNHGEQTIVLPIDLKTDITSEEKADASTSSESMEDVMKAFLTEYYTYNKNNRGDVFLKDMDAEEYYRDFGPLATEKCLDYLEANRMPFKYERVLSVYYTSVEVTDISLSLYADTTYDYTAKIALHTEEPTVEMEVSGQISVDEEQRKVCNLYERESKEVYDILSGKQIEPALAEAPLTEEMVNAALKETALPWVLSAEETDSYQKGHVVYVLRDPKRTYTGEETDETAGKIMYAAIVGAITEGEHFQTAYFTKDCILWRDPSYTKHPDTGVIMPDFAWEDWKQEIEFATLLYGGFENKEEVYRTLSQMEVEDTPGYIRWEAQFPNAYCIITRTQLSDTGMPAHNAYSFIVNFYESKELFDKLQQKAVVKTETEKQDN